MIGCRKPLSSCACDSEVVAGWTVDEVAGFGANFSPGWGGCWNIIVNFYYKDYWSLRLCSFSKRYFDRASIFVKKNTGDLWKDAMLTPSRGMCNVITWYDCEAADQIYNFSWENIQRSSYKEGFPIGDRRGDAASSQNNLHFIGNCSFLKAFYEHCSFQQRNGSASHVHNSVRASCQELCLFCRGLLKFQFATAMFFTKKGRQSASKIYAMDITEKLCCEDCRNCWLVRPRGINFWSCSFN